VLIFVFANLLQVQLGGVGQIGENLNALIENEWKTRNKQIFCSVSEFLVPNKVEFMPIPRLQICAKNFTLGYIFITFSSFCCSQWSHSLFFHLRQLWFCVSYLACLQLS